jgi:hypothetical protein
MSPNVKHSNVTTLGIVMTIPADAGLNPNDTRLMLSLYSIHI